MSVYAAQNGLAEEWADVLDLIAAWERRREERTRKPMPGAPDSVPPDSMRLHSIQARRNRSGIRADRPTFGPPLMASALAHGPTNEAGVIYLFGMLARQLGFIVTRIQSEFPDCEAMCEVEKHRWQRVRIEFEYESRNFLKHCHRAEDCDVIVCWTHNWPDCPLEVVELSDREIWRSGDLEIGSSGHRGIERAERP